MLLLPFLSLLPLALSLPTFFSNEQVVLSNTNPPSRSPFEQQGSEAVHAPGHPMEWPFPTDWRGGRFGANWGCPAWNKIDLLVLNQDSTLLATGRTGVVDIFNISDLHKPQRAHSLMQRGNITSISFNPTNSSLVAVGSRWEVLGDDGPLDQSKVQLWELGEELRSVSGLVENIEETRGTVEFFVKVGEKEEHQWYDEGHRYEEVMETLKFDPSTYTTSSSVESPYTWVFAAISTPLPLPSDNSTLSIRLDSLVFHPDGSLLFFPYGVNEIHAFNVSSKAVQYTLHHSDPVVWYGLSPDSKLLATASWDKTIKIWCSSTGALLNTIIETNEVGLSSIGAWSPDSRYIAIGSHSANWKQHVMIYEATNSKGDEGHLKAWRMDALLRTLRWDRMEGGVDNFVIASERPADNHADLTNLVDIVTVPSNPFTHKRLTQPLVWNSSPTDASNGVLNWSRQLQGDYIAYYFAKVGSIVVYNFVSNKKWEFTKIRNQLWSNSEPAPPVQMSFVFDLSKDVHVLIAGDDSGRIRFFELK